MYSCWFYPGVVLAIGLGYVLSVVTYLWIDGWRSQRYWEKRIEEIKIKYWGYNRNFEDELREGFKDD